MITQTGMKALGVVEAVYVAAELGGELRIGCEDSPLDELCFERAKEAFHVGVVLTGARPIHAGDDPALTQVSLEAIGRVLNSPVGMKHQARLGIAREDRTLQGSQRDFHGSATTDGPADDAPGE